MKNLIRTVSVNVNGKKVDIRFFSDPEIIKEENNRKEKGAIVNTTVNSLVCVKN